MSSELIVPEYDDYYESSAPYLQELFTSVSFQHFRHATDKLDWLSRSTHLGIAGLGTLRDAADRLAHAEDIATQEFGTEATLALRIRTHRELAALRAHTGSLLAHKDDSRMLAGYESIIMKPAYESLLGTAADTLEVFQGAEEEDSRERIRGLLQEQTLFALGLRPIDGRHFIIPATAQQDYKEERLRFDAIAYNSRRPRGDIRRAIQVRTKETRYNWSKDRPFRKAQHATVVYGASHMANVAGHPLWRDSIYDQQPFPTLQAMVDEFDGTADTSASLDIITAKLQRRLFS